MENKSGRKSGGRKYIYTLNSTTKMNETIKLLLVEDDDALRFIVKDNLEQNNYQVDVAEDGQEAIDLFEKKQYHLIILDVMLPKIDGFKVAEHIRKTNEIVPIIFLTARSMTEDKITGLTIGGDDYIPKPFQHGRVVAEN
jgi:DNA-binding response OmpR family regulator